MAIERTTAWLSLRISQHLSVVKYRVEPQSFSILLARVSQSNSAMVGGTVGVPLLNKLSGSY